jgi:hypothetical protein
VVGLEVGSSTTWRKFIVGSLPFKKEMKRINDVEFRLNNLGVVGKTRGGSFL